MELIVTTPEQLKAIVNEAFFEFLPHLHEPKPVSERMPIGEIVQYMGNKGFITTKTSVYTLVSQGRIPYEKVNGKLIFSRANIDGWLKTKVKT